MSEETFPAGAGVSPSPEPAAPETAPEAGPAASAATEAPRPRPGRSGRWWWWIATGALVVAVAVGAFFLGRWAGNDSGGTSASPVTTTSTAPTGSTIGSSEEPVADVAAALSPSVVQIETPNGLGSGVVYRADGYVLTAAHVVAGFDRVTVRLADGTRLDATVAGADTSSDVAVLQVGQTGLPAALLGDSDEVRVGQMAIAIGSPWGLDQTVTSGVLSSVGRTITGSDGIPRTMIQTDAPINPGNSGGALADRHGRVIGINDAIYSSSGGSDGVGFAIPIDTAVSVADRLIAGEAIKTAFLGVEGTEPTTGPVGALITGVVKDSPAAAAGLRVGDLVTAYDGRPIQSFTDLGAAVRSSRPGDTVTLTVTRAEQQITITATLGERPGE